MFRFIRDLPIAIFKVVTSKRRNLVFTLLILRKQNEILKRQIDSRKERLHVSSADRWSLAMINSLSKVARSHLQIFKPETVLAWQRRFISKRWTYPKSLPGRKPVKREIKKLILEMKNDNSLQVMVILSNNQFCLDYAIIIIGAAPENGSDEKSATPA